MVIAALDRSDPHHQAAARALRRMLAGGTRLLLSLVNYAEALVRPAEDARNLRAATDAIETLSMELVAPTAQISRDAATFRATAGISLPEGFALATALARGYDANGDLHTITPPTPQGPTTLGHDGLSRITSAQDGLLQTTNYTYDGDDRVTRIDYPDGQYVSFTYDGVGNVTQLYDSAAGTQTFTFDTKNRLVSDTGPTGSDTYTYDGADNLKTVTDGGGTVTYAYDAANNACWAYVGTSSNACATVPTGATKFTYDNDANRTKTEYPGNVRMDQTWDNDDRLTEIKGLQTAGPTTLTDYQYSYLDTGTDKGRRSSVVDASNNKTTFSYDTHGHITEALTKTAGGGGSTVSDYKYDYDSNGNLRHKSDSSGATWTTLGYGSDNQLCWTASGNLTASACGSPPTGATTFTYDAAGQETAQSGRGTASYNKRHATTSLFGTSMSHMGSDQSLRLTSGTSSFKYNALGLGTKTAASVSSYYTRDPDGGLLSDRTSAGTYNYLFDGLGSVVALTDSSGNVAKRYSYDPYGTVTAGTGSVDNPWQYAGGIYDSGPNVVKFGQRYYDPSIGRWTQPDPIDATGIRLGNDYLYAGSDPINSADPSGRSLGGALTTGLDCAGALATRGRESGFVSRCSAGVAEQGVDVSGAGDSAKVGAGIGATAVACGTLDAPGCLLSATLLYIDVAHPTNPWVSKGDCNSTGCVTGLGGSD